LALKDIKVGEKVFIRYGDRVGNLPSFMSHGIVSPPTAEKEVLIEL